MEKRQEIKEKRVQLVRIEQIYPFPAKTLAKLIKRFVNAEEYIWCQEEPQNMGCWNTVERYINWTLNHIKSYAKNIKYIGRGPMASTATGYLKKHVAQQQEIVTKALTING